MRALCISGGGERGAFSTGVCQYLLGDLKISYDIFTGSSVGALNSAFLGCFPVGQEFEASTKLTSLWLNLKKEDVYKEWLCGKISGFWRSSFVNSKPLHKLIEKNISSKKLKASGKKVCVGAVAVETGKYHLFHQDDPNFIKAVSASSSFPGGFIPVKFNGLSWIDAGIKSCSPLSTAINMGATEIDVIINSPELRVKRFKDDPTAIDILYRSLELSTDKILTSDLQLAEMYNKLASNGLSDKKEVKINIIRPSQNLTDDMLKFDPGQIRSMIDIGYMEAKKTYKL